MKALAYISHCVESRNENAHPLTLYDLNQINRMNLYGDVKPCVYCLAFSYWYHLVAGIPLSPAAGLKDYSKYFQGNPFYKYESPMPMDICWTNGPLYEPGSNFQSMLYQNDLRRTYLNLAKDVAIAVCYGGDPKSFREHRKTGCGEGLRSHQYDWPLYCYIDNNQIHAIYPSSPVMVASDLPPIEDANRLCLDYRSYLYERLLHSERETDNRLTNSQLMTFQYGHVNEFQELASVIRMGS